MKVSSNVNLLNKGLVEKKLINSNLVNNLDFFLSEYEMVESLGFGAEKNGGATQKNELVFSNFENNENIRIYENNNIIELFVPSTLDVDTAIDNTKIVEKYKVILENFTKNMDISFDIIQAKGSYYSDDMQKVIYEDITIIQCLFNSIIDLEIINNFSFVASLLCREMTQECISLNINNQLLLINTDMK